MAKTTLDDIQKAIDAINKTIQSGQGKITQTAKEYAAAYKNVEEAGASLEQRMKGIRQTQLEMNSELQDIKERFIDIGKELNGQNQSYNNAYKSFTKLLSYAEDLSDIQYDLSASSLKDTKNLKAKVNIEFNRLKNQKRFLENQLSSLHFGSEEYKKTKELLELATDEAKAFEEKIGYQDKFNSAIDETYKKQKRVHNSLGITGKLVKGIGGFFETIGFDDLADEIDIAKDKMGEMAIAITNNGEKAAGFVGTMKVGLTGLKSLGKSILSSLTDPLVVLAMATKAIKGLIDLSNEYGKNVAEVATSFGVAGKNAEEVYKTIEHASSINYFPEELLKGQQAYNEALGMNLKFNQENAEIMQDLTTRLGYSGDAASKLMLLSAATGENYYDISKDVSTTVTNFNKQNKTGVSLKKVMETIAGASASTRFNIKGGTKGLAESAALAAKYGVTMDEIANSAKSLLNFEDSISSELEAELLTGKDINLEKLRYAALTGDTNTQLKEQERLVKQNFKSLKGNVIAQDAFAKSIGMSTEDVAKMVEQQERIKKIGAAKFQQEQDNEKAIAEQVKESENLDRSLKAASVELKKALLPLVKAITPFFQGMAKAVGTIGRALSGETGKMMLKIIGGLAAAGGAVYIGAKVTKGIKNLFGGGLTSAAGDMVGGNQPGTQKKGFLDKILGKGGKIGESASNPMYVYVVNQGGGGEGGGEGGGGGEGDIAESLGKRNKFGMKAFKGISKLFGGKKTMVGRGFRNLAAMMGKRTGFGTQVMQGLSKTKAGGAIGRLASTLGFGGAQAAASGTQAAASGVQAAASGGSWLSKAWSGVKGFAGKAGGAISKGLGGVKSILGSPIAKGFGKALGPIFAAISGIASVSSIISDARAQKSKGQKVDMGSLGKKIVQAGVYPIANLATNLIPGVGTAISIADGILGAFNMSPIKWITDNLIDLVPNEAFTGLGKLALGEKAMALGGIATGPTRALVGEAGAEAVVPLDKFYAKFDELIAAVKSGGNVYLDSTKVGTAMAVGTYKVQ
jgi:hypothetical protein